MNDYGVTMQDYLIHNLETDKLELHFKKATYSALPAERKKQLKSICLFSSNASAWVSKGKVSGHSWNISQVKDFAKELGLSNAGTTGEKLTLVEQQEKRVERAEFRESLDLAGKAHRAFSKAEARYEARDKSISQRYPSVWITGASNYPISKQRKGIEGHFSNMSELRRQQGLLHDRLARADPQHLQKIKSKVYLTNRIKDAKAEWRRWQRYKAESERPSEQTEAKIVEYRDLITYFQGLLDDLGGIEFTKERLLEEGATHVLYKRRPFPIVRLNEKTITIGNWLRLGADSTFSLDYSDIGGYTIDPENALIGKLGEKKERPKSAFKKGDVVLATSYTNNGYALRKILSMGSKNVKFERGSPARLKDIYPKEHKSDERLAEFRKALEDYQIREPKRFADYFPSQLTQLTQLRNSPYYISGSEKGGYVSLLENDLQAQGHNDISSFFGVGSAGAESRMIQARAKMKMAMFDFD